MLTSTIAVQFAGEGENTITKSISILLKDVYRVVLFLSKIYLPTLRFLNSMTKVIKKKMAFSDLTQRKAES